MIQQVNYLICFEKFIQCKYKLFQDTFWRKSLLEVDLNESLENKNADIIFDRGIDAKNGHLIAGGYYLAKPTHKSKYFFKKLSDILSWWYVPGQYKLFKFLLTKCIKISCTRFF